MALDVSFRGVPKLMALGAYPDLSLQVARDLDGELRKVLNVSEGQRAELRWILCHPIAAFVGRERNCDVQRLMIRWL